MRKKDQLYAPSVQAKKEGEDRAELSVRERDDEIKLQRSKMDRLDGRRTGADGIKGSRCVGWMRVDMRTAEKASSSPSRRAASLAAFHDGDGVVYVTDGAESDDRRPSVRRRPRPSVRRREEGQLQSLVCSL